MPSNWRHDDGDTIDITPLRHTSGPGGLSMEVCTSYADNIYQTYGLGKRSLNELDDTPIAQGRAQRRKPEINSSRSEEQDISATPFNSVEETDVFLQGPLLASEARSPIVITHSDHHQKLFDKYKLAWGVQWEIARLVSSQKLQYDQILIDDLRKLEGPNAVAAPLVEQLLLPQKRDMRYRRRYEEAYERELNTRVRTTLELLVFVVLNPCL